MYIKLINKALCNVIRPVVWRDWPGPDTDVQILKPQHYTHRIFLGDKRKNNVYRKQISIEFRLIKAVIGISISVEPKSPASPVFPPMSNDP